MEANGDEFGLSVSISDNGAIIAIGGDANDGKNGEDSGHVRIYHLGDGYELGTNRQGYRW